MKQHYVEQMMRRGYTPDHISEFHQYLLRYLGEVYFPSKMSMILDIGAGSGHSLLPLFDLGWKNLQAVDLDEACRSTFESRGIPFYCVDVEKNSLPFADQTFDVILSFHVIEHLMDPYTYLHEVRRVLRENGVFILVTPDWRKQYKIFFRDHTHVHPYDKESIRRVLECHSLFPVLISNVGVMRGIGRTGIWKFIPRFMFTGIDMLAVARKD